MQEEMGKVIKSKNGISPAQQWRLANRGRHPLLERCCMGVVNQIEDLDNSSSVN